VLYPNQLPAEVRDDIAAIESADFLIVQPGLPRSFTGLFKHLFDFVDHNALNDVPVLLAATGGSDRHALVIDHQLRPLFSFFQAQTLPIGVYGAEADFENYRVTNPALQARISPPTAPPPSWPAAAARPRLSPPEPPNIQSEEPPHEPAHQIRLLGAQRQRRPGRQQDRAAHRLGLDYNQQARPDRREGRLRIRPEQIRFTAGYGAEYQHESVSFSHALLAATES
jgi:hypothetical protein